MIAEKEKTFISPAEKMCISMYGEEFASLPDRDKRIVMIYTVEKMFADLYKSYEEYRKAGK